MTASKANKVLRFVAKVVDSSIAFGCAIALSLTAFKIILPPASIIAAFGSSGAAWLWAMVCFVSYVAIIIGVWIKKPTSGQILRNEDVSVKGSGDFYLYFLYPGLITASISTMVYAIAVLAHFGLASLIAIGFTMAIGLYFFCRWLILWISLRVAKKKQPTLIRD